MSDVDDALDALRAAEAQDDAHAVDEATTALKRRGAAVVEPTLARASAARGRWRDLLLEILADSGVKDDRIYALLVEDLARNPSLAALSLGSYGDARALPALEAALAKAKIDDDTMGQAIIDVTDAIAKIAGSLTPAQQARRDEVGARRSAFIDRVGQGPVRVAGKPGRNDPCPCGSGKKYKKCHGGAAQ